MYKKQKVHSFRELIGTKDDGCGKLLIRARFLKKRRNFYVFYLQITIFFFCFCFTGIIILRN